MSELLTSQQQQQPTPGPALEALNSSLDTLEATLAPLLEKPLAQTLEPLDLVQKARTEVLLAYIIQDLVWIYLRTRGVDPKTHPVSVDLDRIKAYFSKIKVAQSGGDKQRLPVDKQAADRFIRAALTTAQAASNPFAEQDAAAAAAAATPSGTHIRFGEVEKEIAEQKAGEDVESEEAEEPTAGADKKGKGKAREGSKKRGRAAMDVWTGYGLDGESGSASAPTGSAKKARKGKKATGAVSADASSEVGTPPSSDGKKKKKKDKAGKKSAQE